MKPGMQYPSMVMIIRHGEKPGHLSKDHDGGPDLSILGSARAAALPSLFTSETKVTSINSLQQLTCDLAVGMESQFIGTFGSSQLKASPSRFPMPNFLFATKGDTGSNRPVETITPLAQALQCLKGEPVPINNTFAHNDKLTLEIRKDRYAGKVILICWHHSKILELAHDLGVPSSQLPWPTWPPTVFDRIFCITWQEGQAKLDVANQLLLHGDPQDYDPSLTSESTTLVLNAPTTPANPLLLHGDPQNCDPIFTSGSTTLVLDAPMMSANSLPKNFRSMNGVNMKDLKGKLASGSAQYSPTQLDNMIKQHVGKYHLTVVDLRQESHGFLRVEPVLYDESEIAVSWFIERDWINVAKGLVSIKADEIRRLTGVAKSQDLEVYVIDTKTPIEAGICTATSHSVFPTGTYDTEQTLLQERNIRYLRLPTTDRCRPRDSEVDQFIAFEKTVEEDTWVHFHCRAGDGRTTTFMAMHDIFHNTPEDPNAPGDSLDFILGRQEGLGGIDLRQLNKSNDSFEHPFERERLEFMKNFYDYVRQAKSGGFKLTWSDWVIYNAT